MPIRPVKRSTLLLANAWLLFAAQSGVALAQTTMPTTPETVLPGRPGVNTTTLDPAFLSTTAGISVRPPSGGKMIRRAGNGDEIVRFISDDEKWTFIVSRILLSEPMALMTHDAPNARLVNGRMDPPPIVGFADTIAGQMPSDTPGKLLRSDFLPISGYEGAILASRYVDHGVKRLMQQAIVRRTDKAYYVITYSAPITQDDVENDPAANRALALFNKSVDSISLVDQDAITRDQTERLIRSRALMVNWTPAKLHDVLVPQQWLRLLKDDKDVGYTYIVEEVAGDLPHKRVKDNEKSVDKVVPDGVRIGVRSRTVPSIGTIVDAESWMWVQDDRKRENFHNQLVSTEKGKEKEFNFAMDAGMALRQGRAVGVLVPDPTAPGGQRAEGDINERYALKVVSSTKTGSLPSVDIEAPPFYLPQALVHLLPRLLPLREPRTYMFASYVPETRQVMTRYVDVLPMTTATLGGKTITAVPIQEKAGLEGSITTHYLSPDGKYLGSVNEENHITILVTDEASLRTIWKDATFERPSDVDDAKK